MARRNKTNLNTKLLRKKTPLEMLNSSEAYYYDVMISSVELKKLIIHRVNELDLDMKKVLREAGINIEGFKRNYLAQLDPLSTPKLRQSHMIKLLGIIGIKTRLQFIVEKNKNNIRLDHLKKD